MKTRILILGAGFGGMELSTRLSEEFGDSIDVTLIDKSDAFVFGYSKLDVMFGKDTLEKVRLPYSRFIKPGVTFRQETITNIDPINRRVTTNAGAYGADYLVVALGADYDYAATPGLSDVNEFYSVEGATVLRDILPTFDKGRVLIGVCGAPYKCPPAPSEAALMLHDYLLKRGVRNNCEIVFTMPLSAPVPPSPDTSRALLAAFAERDIEFRAQTRVASIDPARKIATMEGGQEEAFDLFFGVPKHRVPDVVIESGMSENGWIPVNPRTLETPWPNVYAIGDGAATGTPKAGYFAEGEAAAVAETLFARVGGKGDTGLYAGRGTCYLEFGGDRIGRVDVDFFSGSHPTGIYHEPSVDLRVHKQEFGSSRRARWFGMQS
jgi:sulfide:quinone oxidoreductase